MAFDHLRGGVLTLGGVNNIDGKQEILDADGNLVGELGVDGLFIYAGGVQLTRYAGGDETTIYLNLLNELFRVTRVGDGMNSEIVSEGRNMSFVDHLDNMESFVNPNEIAITKNQNVVFYVNGDRSELLMYGSIYCETFQCAQGANGTFRSADNKTITVTNGIITAIT
jgi:hypothetical protein